MARGVYLPYVYTYHITFDHTSSTDGVPSPGSDGQRGSLAICLFIHIISHLTIPHPRTEYHLLDQMARGVHLPYVCLYISSHLTIPHPRAEYHLPDQMARGVYLPYVYTYQISDLQDELKRRETRWSAAAARYRDKIESLERQNKELQEEVKLLEKYRLERWHGEVSKEIII